MISTSPTSEPEPSEYVPSEYATDTMGLVLKLERRRLGASAQAVFAAADAGQTIIHIPAMVFAEIAYLSEKSRISLTLAETATYLQENPSYRESPMTLAVAEAALQITDIPELHDRLIAATALHLRIPLLANDPVILPPFLQTTW